MFKSISQYIKFTTSKETLKGFFSQKCGNFLPCPVAISVHLHYCRDFIFFFSKKNLADICRIIIHTFFSFCYFCGSEKKGNKPRTVLHFIFLLAKKKSLILPFHEVQILVLLSAYSWSSTVLCSLQPPPPPPHQSHFRFSNKGVCVRPGGRKEGGVARSSKAEVAKKRKSETYVVVLLFFFIKVFYSCCYTLKVGQSNTQQILAPKWQPWLEGWVGCNLIFHPWGAAGGGFFLRSEKQEVK